MMRRRQSLIRVRHGLEQLEQRMVLSDVLSLSLIDADTDRVISGYAAITAGGSAYSNAATVTTPAAAAQAVVSFSLINADTDQVISGYATISPGATLNLATLPTRNLNVRANTSPATVGSVRFNLDGAHYRTESAAPYALAGDTNGDYWAWTPSVGQHTLTATPYSAASGGGTAGTPLTITFTVTDSTGVPNPVGPIISGVMQKWSPVTIDFAGPNASETDSAPNPFLDYRLQVTFTGPGGQVYHVPGFFDGNGQGHGTGNVWRVRFAPDEAGQWQYVASFRAGSNVAVNLGPSAGTPTHFDGVSGSFAIAAQDQGAPGFLKWGRLEYVDGYYLKFRDGSYWIKGGANSPENILGYAGFDNTPDANHQFADHVADWRTGDPDWGDGKGKGIIGALNYLASRNVNSIYLLPMNIGGDGQDTWPFVGPIQPGGSPSNDNRHYDISKLDQWEVVFAHAQRLGIHLHVVLNEAETSNKRELDDATLGVERKLFYRELVARFGHHNALTWNISEEYDLDLDLGPDRVKEFAGYLQAADPYDHPITVHQFYDPDNAWTPFLGDSRFSITSFQYLGSVAGRGDEVEEWRIRTAQAGRRIPISLDELRSTTTANMDAQRKDILWPTYLSGGQLEWFIGDEDQSLEDFRRYQALWDYTWYARKFMEENLPFWEMQPDDALLSGEAGKGQVFTKPGEVYAIYLPSGGGGTLDLRGASGTFSVRWYNPRTGLFAGSAKTVQGDGFVSLGNPPNSSSQDWVVLVK